MLKRRNRTSKSKTTKGDPSSSWSSPSPSPSSRRFSAGGAIEATSSSSSSRRFSLTSTNNNNINDNNSSAIETTKSTMDDATDSTVKTSGGDSRENLSISLQSSARFSRSSIGGGGGENTAPLWSASGRSSYLEPISVMTTRRSLRDATIDFSVNKLKFHDLGVLGREREIAQLETIVQRMVSNNDDGDSSTKTDNSGNDNGEVDEPQQQQHQQKTEPSRQALRKKEFVLLSGYSGTGKSALVTSSTSSTSAAASLSSSYAGLSYMPAATSMPSSSPFGDIVKNKFGGSLVLGKFDQSFGGNRQEQQQRPFTAFQMLCEKLVPEMIGLKKKKRNQGTTYSMKKMKRIEVLQQDETETTISPTMTSVESDDDDDDDGEEERPWLLSPSSMVEEKKKPVSLFEEFQMKLMKELGTAELNDLIQIFPALDVLLNDDGHDSHSDHYQYSNDDDDDVSSDSDELLHDDTINNSDDNNQNDYIATRTMTGTNATSAMENFGTVGTDSRHRINYAFKILLRILSLYVFSSPFVIVLDDLQWADAASLDLLETIITDYESPNIMIIGVYRSNEVNVDGDDNNNENNRNEATHLLSQMIRNLRNLASSEERRNNNRNNNNNINMTEIEIGNLDVIAVHEMIQTLLGIDDDDDITNTDSVPNSINGNNNSNDVGRERIWKLSKLCHTKTGGNAFYLIHFISMLYDVHLLEYNLGTMKWEWDIQKIEYSTTATFNVVDMLKRQMGTKLSIEDQKLLQYASYLGSTFDGRTIFVLWKEYYLSQQGQQQNINNMMTNQQDGNSNGNSDSDCKESNDADNDNDDDAPDNSKEDSLSVSPNSSSPLDALVVMHLSNAILRCQESGFFEILSTPTTTTPTTSGKGRGGGEKKSKTSKSYRWVHDKLQEAAMELIPTETRRDFGQHVAEVLINRLTDAEIEEVLFVVTDRYNEGGLSTDHSISKRIKLAELNLRAANKAVSYSAFESAASYCKHGIQMLPDDRWEKHYKLSLELYSLGAETEGFIGNLPAIELYTQEVLKQTKSTAGLWMIPSSLSSSSSSLAEVRDKFRVYNVIMKNAVSRKLYTEASELCLEVLEKYGMSFPRNKIGTTCHVVYNIVKIKSSIKQRTREEVQNLPIMDDPAKVEQMGLLNELQTQLYLLRHPLLPLCIFKTLQFTLDHGLSKFSPPSFGTTGVILAAKFGDLKGCATYAKYAMMLLERLDPNTSRQVESRTRFIVYNLAMQWTQPLRGLLKPLLRGYEIGMLVGDTESAILCIYAYIAHSLFSGRNLKTLADDCRAYCAQMNGLNNSFVLNNTRITWQVVLNLIGDENTSKLMGEALPEDTYNADSEDSAFFRNILDVQESVVCGYFGDYKTGAEMALKRGSSFLKGNVGSAFSVPDVFHRCLSLLAMARKRKEVGEVASGISRSKEVKYIKSAKEAHNQIRKWVEQGNPNVKHHEALLDAEFAVYEDRTNDAKKYYQTATFFAVRGGFINDSALINERYGEYLLRCSREAKIREEQEQQRTTGGVTGIPTSMVDSSGAYYEEATFRLKESMKLYREWGAIAKVEQMEQQYEHIFVVVPPTEIVLHQLNK